MSGEWDAILDAIEESVMEAPEGTQLQLLNAIRDYRKKYHGTWRRMLPRMRQLLTTIEGAAAFDPSKEIPE